MLLINMGPVTCPDRVPVPGPLGIELIKNFFFINELFVFLHFFRQMYLCYTGLTSA